MKTNQQDEATKIMVKARMALEHALPVGTSYVAVISASGAGGFNTWASNLKGDEAIELLRGLIQALERDKMIAGRG